MIIGGDFNEPSHLDGPKRGNNPSSTDGCPIRQIPGLGKSISWKGSQVMSSPARYKEDLDLTGPMPGLTDVFRALYPIETAHPGHTWTPRYIDGTQGRGHWDADGFDDPLEAQKTAALDRIDMIYASQDLEPVRVHVLGDHCDPSSSIGFEEWPSDHRAVLATLRWYPDASD